MERAAGIGLVVVAGGALGCTRDRGTGDEGAFEQIPPFFAWRPLVLASPTWYPDVPESVRVTLLEAAVSWLNSPKFDPESIETDVPMLVAPRR